MVRSRSQKLRRHVGIARIHILGHKFQTNHLLCLVILGTVRHGEYLCGLRVFFTTKNTSSVNFYNRWQWERMERRLTLATSSAAGFPYAQHRGWYMFQGWRRLQRPVILLIRVQPWRTRSDLCLYQPDLDPHVVRSVHCEQGGIGPQRDQIYLTQHRTSHSR